MNAIKDSLNYPLVRAYIYGDVGTVHILLQQNAIAMDTFTPSQYPHHSSGSRTRVSSDAFLLRHEVEVIGDNQGNHAVGSSVLCHLRNRIWPTYA